jgi:hypothetical protein
MSSGVVATATFCVLLLAGLAVVHVNEFNGLGSDDDVVYTRRAAPPTSFFPFEAPPHALFLETFNDAEWATRWRAVSRTDPRAAATDATEADVWYRGSKLVGERGWIVGQGALVDDEGLGVPNDRGLLRAADVAVPVVERDDQHNIVNSRTQIYDGYCADANFCIFSAAEVDDATMNAIVAERDADNEAEELVIQFEARFHRHRNVTANEFKTLSNECGIGPRVTVAASSPKGAKRATSLPNGYSIGWWCERYFLLLATHSLALLRASSCMFKLLTFSRA